MIERTQPSSFAARAMSEEIVAVRKPAFYKDQSSLPGYFWMSKMGTLVMYESRLEMIVLLQLDFHPHVVSVVSQPCIIHYQSDSKKLRHTPDFFVLYDNDVGELVNVKPKKFIGTEKNLRSFGVCEKASEAMGFACSVRTEIEPVFLNNLRWLGGYRRLPPHTEIYWDFLITCASEEMTIGEITIRAETAALMKPVLFHMIWKGLVWVDLYARLSRDSIVSLGGIDSHV